MSPFQLDDSRSCLLHDSVPQPDLNSGSVASTKLPILVAVNLSSFQSRQNRSLETPASFQRFGSLWVEDKGRTS
ncbi:hypothetical protein LINPERHAP2_LOCUS22755, partial [Linum perenne]